MGELSVYGTAPAAGVRLYSFSRFERRCEDNSRKTIEGRSLATHGSGAVYLGAGGLGSGLRCSVLDRKLLILRDIQQRLLRSARSGQALIPS